MEFGYHNTFFGDIKMYKELFYEKAQNLYVCDVNNKESA